MPSLFDMSGKVAVVTGSSRGIGRAIAERFAEHGAKVVVSSRKPAACDEVTKAINDRHGAGTAMTIAANISSKEELKNLVDKTHRRNSARSTCWSATRRRTRITARWPASATTSSAKSCENNIIANNWLISFTVPQMIERKDGSIIIISSVGGYKGSTTIGAYCISKAADLQLARNLAVEYGKHNIRVNCIAPGLIKTDFAKALWDNPETLKVTEERSPMRRIGQPDEIAGGAVFLASKAGAFVNGQSIVIDGGGTIS